MAKRRKKKTGLPYPKMKLIPTSAFSPFGAYHRWFKARVLLPLLLKYGFPAFLFVTLPLSLIRYISHAIGNGGMPVSSGEITLHVIAYGIAFALAWYKYQHYMAYYYYVSMFHHARMNHKAMKDGEEYGSPQHQRRQRANAILLFPTPLILKYGADVMARDLASTRTGDKESGAQQQRLLAPDSVREAHKLARILGENAQRQGVSDTNDYLVLSKKYRSRCAPERQSWILPTKDVPVHAGLASEPVE